MLCERKRGAKFHVEGRIAGERVRLALGTANRENARATVRDIERAVSAGANSSLWPKLKTILPPKSFDWLAAKVGYQETAPVSVPSWTELARLFDADARRRIVLGKFRESSLERYLYETREFGDFLAERGIADLCQIERALVEQWKAWRLGRISSRNRDGSARSLALCAAILHRVFAFALENEMIVRNPVRLEGRPGHNPERGSQPFKPDELRKLREHSGPDFLTFELLKWTGLRGSDAVALTWAEVDFDAQEIVRVTQKRGKRVVVPIHSELLFALEMERDRRNPDPCERVLLNPETGKAFTRPRLYSRMMALGRRAGVSSSNPHRFRDSLAVEMLTQGATPYDVAKVLGDTIETVEQHYAPFVRELRERVRRIMESVPAESVEKLGTIWAQSGAKTSQVQ
ncbi:MAG TPA: tyrosine-type recombinase/integrase [Candidatus Dormibacteraeota bacterium]|nr:tyrosine-type recombinase/integrase [Candidatus Dormibacteraeota bacterium]